MDARIIPMPEGHKKMKLDRTRRILIAGAKGGTGKSFLTKNLAVAAAAEGYKVAIVDYDPQRSIKPWLDARILNIGEHNTIEAYEADIADADSTKEVVTMTDFDFVFIDMPPSVGSSDGGINTLLIKCDLTIIPTRYGWTDILSTKTLLGMTALLDVQPMVVINAVKSKAANALGRCIEELSGYASISPVFIPDYVSFIDIDSEGLGAVEIPKFAGRESLSALWNDVKRNLGVKVAATKVVAASKKRKVG